MQTNAPQHSTMKMLTHLLVIWRILNWKILFPHLMLKKILFSIFAGYIARSFCKKSSCKGCNEIVSFGKMELRFDAEEILDDSNSINVKEEFTKIINRGGLTKTLWLSLCYGSARFNDVNICQRPRLSTKVIDGIKKSFI